jgi:hypothetical protein
MSIKNESFVFNQDYPQKTFSTLYNINNLTKIRIIQKNIVYIIGIPLNLSSPDKLSKYEYLGQYGKIKKIIVNKNGYSQNKNSSKTYSAYITYSSFEEASLALLAIDNNFYDDNLLRTSYGTTKYCNFFLKGINCLNRDCLYMHNWANDNDMILKEDCCSNKQIFYLQQKIAVKYSEIFNEEKKNYLIKKGNKDKKFFLDNNLFGFPTVDMIYDKHVIYDIQKEIFFEIKKNSIFNYNNNENLNNDFNFGEFNDDLEYVLVREPNKKRKKYKNSSKKNLKYIINENEENQIIKLKSNLNSSETTANSLNSSERSSNKNLYNSNSGSSNCSDFKFNNNLFCHPEKSRFDFANNNEKNCLNIPKFIFDIINIKYKSFSFFNQMKFVKPIIDDNFLFSKEKNDIKKWNLN